LKVENKPVDMSDQKANFVSKPRHRGTH
jgi:hypothetical protein